MSSSRFLENAAKGNILERGVYKEFECCLSKDKHIVEDPCLLTLCDHYTCRRCLPKNDADPVTCRICFKVTERSLVSDNNCDKIKSGIKCNIDSLLRVIQRQMHDSLTMVTDVFNTNKDSINTKIEFVKEEIEIKIESVKCELDELNTKFIKQLDNLRADILDNEDEVNTQIEFSESVLYELRRDIESKSNLNEEKLYEYQNRLRALNSLIETLTSCTFYITFDESSVGITKDKIGTVNCSTVEPLDDLKMRNILKAASPEDFHLNTEPNDMCVLPSGNLAICNSTKRSIAVFNKDFSLVQTIEKIDEAEFHPLRITTDEKKRIFIVEFIGYQVLMTDLNFKLIKKVGSKGDAADQLDYPNGISYFDNQLFVCDTKNKRLQVLSRELEFKKTIRLKYEPWIIKISPKRVACISRFDKAGIYFYDFDTFTLKAHYNNHGYGRVSELGSYFVESCKRNTKLYFYDKNGLLVENIDVQRLGNCIRSTADGVLVYFNKHLVISSSSEKKIVKFV